MDAEATRPAARRPSGRGPGVPRWPAAVVLLLLGLAYALEPTRLRLGPRWLLLIIVVPLLAVAILSRRRGYHDVAHWLGRALTALVTLGLAIGVVFLLTRLPGEKVSGEYLLGSAALLWATNIAVFTLWYWELDGGGPGVRHPGAYHSDDFVFPQLQQDPQMAEGYWLPGLIDYLFLAFNTSTAFSPTDTLVLSQRAKVLMMAQSLISLVVLAFVAARAINVL